MAADYITYREFSDRLASIDRGLEKQGIILGEIKIHLATLHGTTASNTKKIVAIEADDERIEGLVTKILMEGCSQKQEHERVLEVLTVAGVLPNMDEGPPKVYTFPPLSTRQKTAAGVGIGALVIPAIVDLFAFLHQLADWVMP